MTWKGTSSITSISLQQQADFLQPNTITCHR